MANRTAWVAGNGAGLSWTTGISTSDMASITTSWSVLSSIADIANGTNLDQFCDISVVCAIASSTVTQGANIAIWIYALNEDGSTYGDGQLASGTPANKTPAFPPCGIIPLLSASSQVTLSGFIQGVILPPGSFRFAMQNNSGFALTAGTQTMKFRTYNQNLNS